MGRTKSKKFAFDFRPFIQEVGWKAIIEQTGLESLVEEIGIEKLLGQLSPEQLQEVERWFRERSTQDR
jgi:hypothetical protein